MALQTEKIMTAIDVGREGYDPFIDMPYEQIESQLGTLFTIEEIQELGISLERIQDATEKRRALNAVIFVKLIDRGEQTATEFESITNASLSDINY